MLSGGGGVVLREQCVDASQDVEVGLVVELDQCLHDDRLGDRPSRAGGGVQVTQDRVRASNCAAPRGACGERTSPRGENAGVRQQQGSLRLWQAVGECREVRREVDRGPVVQDRRQFPSHPLLTFDARREFRVQDAQVAEQLTRAEGIARHTGTFTSPIGLPKRGNTVLGLATAAASTERALRLRYGRLLDGAG